MTDRPERATAAQADLLARLIESSVFSDNERDAVKAELFGAYPLTKERATKLIDRTLKVLKARKQAEAGPVSDQGSSPAGATGVGGRPPVKATASEGRTD